jgi:hypothetical protein
VKNLSALLLVVSASMLAGCESGPSLPAAFRERISPTYRSHVVAVEQKPAYDAARLALRKMNFTITSGGAAQGRIEALSALQPGAGAGSARQVSVSVKLAPAANGGTDVSALFSEIREDSFSKREGMGTSTPMRESSLYEVFFAHLDAALVQPTLTP